MHDEVNDAVSEDRNTQKGDSDIGARHVWGILVRKVLGNRLKMMEDPGAKTAGQVE